MHCNTKIRMDTQTETHVLLQPICAVVRFDQIQTQSVFNCQSKQHLEVSERGLKEARKMDLDGEENIMRF